MKNIRQFIRETIHQQLKNRNILNEKLVLSNKERVHLSTEKIETFNDIIQGQSVFGKPKGLWYGFGDSWIRFAKYEFDEDSHHNFNKKKFAYKVYPDLKKVISLKTEGEVLDFTQKYLNDFPDRYEDYNINWNSVAKDYSGIEIPTYNELGMHNWYEENKKMFWWLYPWDVPSGCIWKSDGLLKLKNL